MNFIKFIVSARLYYSAVGINVLAPKEIPQKFRAPGPRLERASRELISGRRPLCVREINGRIGLRVKGRCRVTASEKA